MRFRKKPIIVDAEQFHPKQKPWPYGVKLNQDSGMSWYSIRTLEGSMLVLPGAWIVTGIMGERYPVQDDIFKDTYEKVEKNETS